MPLLKSYISILSIALAFVLSSCKDDLLYDPDFIGEGDAEVTAEITFPSERVALSRAAGDGEVVEGEVKGGEPGDAISTIESVCILFYDAQLGDNYGKFVKKYYFGKGSPDMTVSGTTDRPSDYPGAGGEPVDDKEDTQRATVRLGVVPYGKYKIYAVANVPEEKFTDDVVSNAENVKNLSFEWSSENVPANNQMFGYFSENNSSDGFQAPDVKVNRPAVRLSAWVRRLASKVTVAFDGSELKPGVEIFIQSVTIKDIPQYCLLGAQNPGKPDEKIDLIADGGTITYNEVADNESASAGFDKNTIGYISLDHQINGSDQKVVDDASLTNDKKLELLHSESARALYLYENMQGMGEANTPSDKRQQVNVNINGPTYPDGVDPSNVAWKDAKKYGSYIEVKAYYRALNSDGTLNEKEGKGEITYRFMLGKDAEFDYNTERNYHYKLTMKFKGWANDVDWHIDYDKEPAYKLRIPRPFYISYLYGQAAMIPIEFEVKSGVKINRVEAWITSNNWAPDGASSPFYKGPLSQSDDESKIKALQPSSDDNSKYYTYVKTMDDPVQFKYNGFLSLRKSKNILAVQGAFPLKLDNNREHFDQYDLGHRKFIGSAVQISNEQPYEAMAKDSLHISKVGKTYFVKLPIWTRARQLISTTGYTGNNPYESYYRKARVHVEIELLLPDGTTKILKSDVDDITSDSRPGEDIEVNQVCRIVNPKGIWRDQNTQPFDVELKVLKNDQYNFETLKSAGPWRAYVILDTDFTDKDNGIGGFIELEGSRETTSTTTTFDYEGKVMTRKSVEGVDESEIKFRVNFTKEKGSEPRYAIIRVEYNYCSCYHLIFVRQGFEADDLDIDGVSTKWCTMNNVEKDELGECPLDEGSLFRYGNWVGIPSSKNVNGKPRWVNVKPDDFFANAASEQGIDWNKISWNEVLQLKTDGYGYDENKNTLPENKFPAPTTGRIAEYKDFATLVPPTDNDQDWLIKTGYGVLYGDGAVATANNIDEAYGYKAGGSVTRGMRGCFVYNKHTGNNLFFPIGSSGYGHRKNKTKNEKRGVLRYSSNERWGYFDAVKAETYRFGIYSAPLFLDIFRSPGAIYWLAENDPGSNSRVAWDINYATFDFSALSSANVEHGADACFIRCVID